MSLFTTLLANQTAHAVTGSDWRPGQIVDDGIFYRNSELSVSDVQSFLNARVPVCDTWGTKPYGGTTRASYAASRGYYTPFTCLKDYSENVTGRYANAYCSTIGGGTRSAAGILYEVSNACGIDVKTLIVMLEKEQGLLSDDWPWSIQYRSAMGYGCPDTAPCDAEYYGFFNQVYNAARQFRLYKANPSGYRYKPFQNNFIQWSPDSNCGGSNVYISNYATAGLYNYTPYQPNQAALSSLYGTGNACSAYGNRNYWRMYHDYFGSTTLYNANATLSQALSVSTPSQSGVYQNETVTASYQVTNTANYPVNVGGLGICARLNGVNYDFGFQDNVTLAANQTLTVSYSKKILYPGNLDIFVCSYNAQVGGWVGNFYPYDTSNFSRNQTLVAGANPVLASPPTFTPTSVVAGQNVTASMQLTNKSSAPITINYPLFVARDAKGQNVDFPSDQNVTISGGATLTYSKTRSFAEIGTVTGSVASLVEGQWTNDYPVSNPGVGRTTSTSVTNNPLLITSASISPAEPAVGENVTATFQIRNNAPNAVTIPQVFLAVSDPRSSNGDFPSDINVTIPANSTYTYSKTRTFSNLGLHRAGVATLNNGRWDTAYPVALNSSIERNINFTTRENPSVTSSLSISPSQPVRGDTVTATFAVRNDSETSVTFPMLLVGARDPHGNNVDFPAAQNVTINPHTTYTYSASRTLPTAGAYRLFITSLNNGQWRLDYPVSRNNGIVRTLYPSLPDNPTITTNLSLSPTTLRVNQSITATYTVNNRSNNDVNTGMAIVAGRDPFGNNVDFPARVNFTVPASSSGTYSQSRTFTIPGTYRFFISHYVNNQWLNSYPLSDNSGIIRSLTTRVDP